MKKNSRIYVAGHKGLVGSAIVRQLNKQGYRNIILKSSEELDLRKHYDVEEFFRFEKPEYVFLAAAKVGGILANSNFPASFLHENILIQSNVIHNSHKYGVKKLLFLGSACIYPKFASQPITEEQLLAGFLEPSNRPYAIAKITGIEYCNTYRRQYGDDFISLMPTNLYGINDYFDNESAHVFPALIRRFHEAKVNDLDEVIVWGSGKPFREFLYVDDLADASIHMMLNYSNDGHINIGTGEDISIKELALLISEIIGFKGEIIFDETKPDGTPRRLLDVSKARKLGWTFKTNLREGIIMTYQWYVNQANFRGK